MSDIVSDRMLYDHLEQVAAKQDEAAYLRYQAQLLTSEVERLRLTGDERLAVERAAITLEIREASKRSHQAGSDALVLRRLLERLG